MKLISLRTFLSAICILLVCHNQSSGDQKPNIVFIFSDDHAPHAIGAYNGWLKSVNPTPRIDELAKQGMLFEKSFSSFK